MGGIDPPGGRRSRITAVMTDAEFALTIRAVALQLPAGDGGRIPPAVPKCSTAPGFPQVCRSGIQDCWIVLQKSNASIAWGAQQAANFSGFVIVIDAKPAVSFGLGYL